MIANPTILLLGAMDRGFALMPVQASAGARWVDWVYYGLIAVSSTITLLVMVLLLSFAIRYRAGAIVDRSNPIRRTLSYEIVWVSVLFVIALGLFGWAAWAYVDISRPPVNAATYYVLGRQWMWEIQHPDGRRELNQFHIPVNQPVKLVLTSEDVIHSFYIPAFRMKMDAVPGRYTTTWFLPTVPGTYHLFCAEYCGADHARMRGVVTVMSPRDYAEWRINTPVAPTAQPLEPTERASFTKLGCDRCHRPESQALAPRLEGLYGRVTQLADGSTVIADEAYIRESILNPSAKIVRGYMPIMPTYQGQLSEQQVRLLVEAVKALASSEQQTEPPQ